MSLQSVIGIFLAVLSISVGAVPERKMNAFPEGERLIYMRIVELYRKNQIDELLKQKRLLESRYPASIHIDNVYYMLGRMDYEAGRYGEALRAFGIIDRRFEKSNKRPAALFAIGSTYQKLGLNNMADHVWHRLISQYPGSQESLRAQMQLRIGAKGSVRN